MACAAATTPLEQATDTPYEVLPMVTVLQPPSVDVTVPTCVLHPLSEVKATPLVTEGCVSQKMTAPATPETPETGTHMDAYPVAFDEEMEVVPADSEARMFPEQVVLV